MTTPSTHPRRRKRLRRTLLSLALIIGVFFATFFIARPFFTRRIVLAQLSSLTGGEAQAQRVSLGPDGVLTIEKGVIRAPGVPGVGGVIFSVDRLEAVVEWRSILAGNPVIKSVLLESPVARISQSVDDGSINLAALTPAKGSGAVRPAVIPRIVVNAGAIEMGEHITAPAAHAPTDPPFVVLRRIPVAGQVEQAKDETGGMTVSFQQLGPDGQPMPDRGALQVTGRVSSDAVTLNLGEVSLTSWPEHQVPRPIREAFRQLALDGVIKGAELTYEFDGGVEARAELAGVGVTLPVEVRPGEDPDGNPIPIPESDKGKRLRLERVTGRVTLTPLGLEAKMTGMLGDLPYEVDFHSTGQTADAPFTCTIRSKNVTLSQKPEVLKFAPGVVRRRMEQFSDPTGVFDAEVTISRAAPTTSGPGAVSVAGGIDFRGTTAAFERFPYRFYNLTGRVDFDDTRVTIRRIDGDAPGGARVTATGTIEPPNDEADVKIDVRVTGLPIDKTLRDAMSTRGRLIEELFNLPAYERLVARGLITPPSDAARATPDKPLFELGGSAEVHAVVWRDPGPGANNWHDRVTISLAQVGVLPERVPYPMIAKGVTILKEDALATVQGGTFQGLRGGAATIVARADMDRLADPNTPFVPEIEIDAENVPVDALLLAAIPTTARAGDRPIGDVLADLRPQGSGTIQARVGPAAPPAKPDDVDYRVLFESRALTLSPPSPASEASARVTLSQGQATVEVTPLTVDADITGVLTAAGDNAPTEGNDVHAVVRVRRPDTDASPTAELDTTIAALNAAHTIEDFARPFSADAAAKLDALRAERQPAGIVDATIKLIAPPEAPVRVTAGATSLRNASFLAADGRLSVTSTKGGVAIDQNGDLLERVTFSGLEASVTFNDAPPAALLVDGSCAGDAAPLGTPLSIQLLGGRFESPLVRVIAGRAAPTRLAAFFRDNDVRGLFDLRLRMTPGAESRWQAEGEILPRSLTARFGETDVEFPTCDGRIEFSPGIGRVKDFTLAAPTWSATAQGAWLTHEDGAVALSAQATLSAQSLTPDLHAVVPEGLREVMKDLAVRCEGAILTQPTAVNLTYSPDGQLQALRVAGRADLARFALDTGVLIEDAAGTLDFEVDRPAPDRPLAFTISGIFDRATVSGVKVTNARTRIIGTPGGDVLIPMFSADCHAGRLAGEATVRPNPAPNAGPNRVFEVSARASGVRLASVLADYAAKTPGAAPVATSDADASRGLLDAAVSLTGTINEPATRRGRGTASVGGGRVVNFPLVVALIRISNLDLPIAESLDYASAEFFIQGNYVNFEELSVFSPSVQIFGFGTVQWPGLELDLRFRPKARRRIPLVTGMLEGIRNELIAVRVEGTLAEPELALTTLSGTSRFIGRLFGESPSEQQQRLDRIEQQALENPRTKHLERGVVPAGSK